MPRLLIVGLVLLGLTQVARFALLPGIAKESAERCHHYGINGVHTWATPCQQEDCKRFGIKGY